jgi:hypothetical protein
VFGDSRPNYIVAATPPEVVGGRTLLVSLTPTTILIYRAALLIWAAPRCVASRSQPNRACDHRCESEQGRDRERLEA